MNKYIEICKNREENRKTFRELHDNAVSFAINLAMTFKKELGIESNSKDYFAVYPAHDEYDLNSIYSILGSVKLDEEGFWGFSFHLKIFKDGNPNIFPYDELRIKFQYKYVDGIKVFRSPALDDVFQVKDGEDLTSALSSFARNVCESLNDSYRDQIINFIRSGTSKDRKIGLVQRDE